MSLKVLLAICCAVLVIAVGNLYFQNRSLSKEVKWQHTSIIILQSHVSAILPWYYQSSAEQQVQELDSEALLMPGSSGYDQINTALGAIIVSFEDASSYANGSKVILRFGNLLSADLSSVSASIEYGPVDDNNLPLYDESKKKRVKFTETLKSGSWTHVTLVLEGFPSDELGYLRISNLHSNEVSLSIH